MRREIVEDNIIFMKHFMRITTWGLRGGKPRPSGRGGGQIGFLYYLAYCFNSFVDSALSLVGLLVFLQLPLGIFSILIGPGRGSDEWKKIKTKGIHENGPR
ncbi:MAG: hypothetical protein RXR16_04220 [Thermocladium sp.]